MTGYCLVHPSSVPLPIRVATKRMVDYAGPLLRINEMGVSYLYTTWFISTPSSAESFKPKGIIAARFLMPKDPGNKVPSAFCCPLDLNGFACRDNPARIYLRADLSVCQTAITVAHEMFHVSEYLRGVPTNEDDAEYFAQWAFHGLRHQSCRC